MPYAAAVPAAAVVGRAVVGLEESGAHLFVNAFRRTGGTAPQRGPTSRASDLFGWSGGKGGVNAG